MGLRVIRREHVKTRCELDHFGLAAQSAGTKKCKISLLLAPRLDSYHCGRLACSPVGIFVGERTAAWVMNHHRYVEKNTAINYTINCVINCGIFEILNMKFLKVVGDLQK